MSKIFGHISQRIYAWPINIFKKCSHPYSEQKCNLNHNDHDISIRAKIIKANNSKRWQGQEQLKLANGNRLPSKKFRRFV